jgi:HD-like signal output (HDOD) protein/CheY-like chemotaxis protein
MPPPLKRILLADRDEAVLAMLVTAAPRRGADWEVLTAESGEDALALLTMMPFDVMIAGTRMSGLSGLELLRATMIRHPYMARMILLDQAEPELMLGALGAAHQYLVKPCGSGELLSAVSRLLALDQFFTNQPLRRVVARIQQLPSPPMVCFRLMKELGRLDATTESVGAIIAQDASLTAKLLQLVNSAFFGLGRRVTNVPDAVQILGFNLVKSLALTFSLFACLNPVSGGELNADRLYLHSLATALLAQTIVAGEAADPVMIAAAFTAGILHDTGKLVLGSAMPELYAQAVRLAADELMPQWQAEANVFGVSHAEVGAYLLGLWGLPVPIVETVAWHHQPLRGEPPVFGMLTAVHIADFLQSRHLPASRRPLVVELDEPYIHMLGLTDRIDEWAEVAGRL